MSMLTELKAAIAKHGNVARTNRFKVDFTGISNKGYGTLNEIKDLEYFLEAVNMPSKDVETVEYSLYRNPISYATGYKNGDFSMTFRAPVDMFVKEIFDRWIEDIIPSGDYKLKYRSQIGVDFTITQISDRKPGAKSYETISQNLFASLPADGIISIDGTINPNPRQSSPMSSIKDLERQYSITVTEAYPISISSIEYSNTQEGEYVTFEVGFAYKDIINEVSKQRQRQRQQRLQRQQQRLFEEIQRGLEQFDGFGPGQNISND